MEQIKNSTVRFGLTGVTSFTGDTREWHSVKIPFQPPFAPPPYDKVKEVDRGISVVVTSSHGTPTVAVVEDVSHQGFTLRARNLTDGDGKSRFAWLAVLGAWDPEQTQGFDLRLGLLQTKVLEPIWHHTLWPLIWYSSPMVSIDPESEPAILLTAHNNTGPCRKGIAWNHPAAVATTFWPLNGGIVNIPQSDGFAVTATNVDGNDGRCGFYYASFMLTGRPRESAAPELWLDHGSEKNVDDDCLFSNPGEPGSFTTPRWLKPAGESGDWTHLDVYFERPFMTPPIVLATARVDAAKIWANYAHGNPLVVMTQNVTTHGFTIAVHNTASEINRAEFYWVAIGGQKGVA